MKGPEPYVKGRYMGLAVCIHHIHITVVIILYTNTIFSFYHALDAISDVV
jgi:hypothetical protein